MLKNNVFLPIEITRRELDYKILLAAELYDVTKRIFIGENEAINKSIRYIDTGSYVGKSFMTPYLLNDISFIDTLKKRSIDIIYIDEEGGVFAGDEKTWVTILKNKFDPLLLGENDFLTTWGDFQKNVYSKVPHKCKIETVGVPRFNLLKKYSDIISKPKSAPEKYILINTNFGFSSSAHGSSYYLNSKYKFMEEERKDLDYKFGRWLDSNITFSYFIKMIYDISTSIYPHKLVIRPHPSEDKSFYLKTFEKFDNVIIDDSSSAINWMKYAEVIIHNGSTSALEGYFLNKHIINFIPYYNKDFIIDLPNRIGVTFSNIEDVLNEIQFIVKNQNPIVKDKKDDNKLKMMIANMDENLDSFVSIRKLIEIQLEKQKKVKLNIKLFYYLYNFFDQRRKIKNLFRKLFLKENYKLYLSMSKKFEPYNKKELTEKIDKAFKLNKKNYKRIHFINEFLIIVE